ncbi:hypothetical protein ACWIVU_11190, partial [Ursidibacter arcticus]
GVGVIAVFFPDLLNLQKEKIKHYSTFLYNEKSLIEFHQFLEKNRDNIVELKIGYCSTGYNPDNLTYSDYEVIVRNPSNPEDLLLVINGEVEDGMGEVGTLRHSGSFSIKAGGENVEVSVDINKNKQSQTYLWLYDGAAYDETYKNHLTKCPQRQGSDLPDIGELSGTFFLTDGIAIEKHFTYSLEPLSKAELNLRKY